MAAVRLPPATPASASTAPPLSARSGKGSKDRPAAAKTVALPHIPVHLPLSGQVESAMDLDLTRVSPGLKTLGRVNAQVEHDAHRYLLRSNQLKGNNANITHMIAQMRQELRGMFLSKVPLLSRDILTEDEQFRLVGKLRPWTFEKCHDIIVEGEIGDKLYIIERGICEAIKRINGREMVVGRLGKGAFFGEIAALYDMPRTATIRAATDVTALSLSRHDLFSTISEEELDKMRIIARTQVFSSIPLLAELSPELKVRVARALKHQRWYKGAILAGASHITSRLFIVEHGTLQMEVPSKEHLPNFMQDQPDSCSQPMLLGPGQYFGMRGLLYEAPVGFNIVCTSDEVQTLSISYEELVDTAEPSGRDTMVATMRRSMQGFLLRQIPQLRIMADAHFSVIREAAEEVHFTKWSLIIARDAPLQAVYVLQCGKLVEYDGDAATLCDLLGTEVQCPERATPGEYFGVECLTNRSACAPRTLVALTDVTLLRLPPEVVWSVLHEERQHISKIPLLSQEVLSKEEQYMLVGKLKAWNFPSGRNIISEGEIGDMLFIIEKGVCDAIKEIDGKEVVVSQLRKGAFFGELAVMYDMPRTATVRAATDVTAVSLSREDLFSAVGAEKVEKMRIIARSQVFSSIPLLADLPTSHKISVAERLRSDAFSYGTAIVKEGQRTERLYIIEQGEVRLVSSKGQENALVAGQFFGMQGLLHADPHHFTVTVESAQAKTLSVSLEEILGTAGTGERPMLERNLRDAMRSLLLRQIPHFRRKGDDYIKTLLGHIEVVRHSAGETVFAKGAVIPGVFVVEGGRLAVVDAETGQPGATAAIFGLDCLRGAAPPAPASVVCAADAQLVKLPASLFAVRSG